MDKVFLKYSTPQRSSTLLKDPIFFSLLPPEENEERWGVPSTSTYSNLNSSGDFLSEQHHAALPSKIMVGPPNRSQFQARNLIT
jgi:hypothetical protein